MISDHVLIIIILQRTIYSLKSLSEYKSYGVCLVHNDADDDDMIAP